LIALIIAHVANINATVSLFSVILSVSVSFLIGIGFGYYPASRAANLNPIEAIRRQ
jgi:putative ABC transport system permease protein